MVYSFIRESVWYDNDRQDVGSVYTVGFLLAKLDKFIFHANKILKYSFTNCESPFSFASVTISYCTSDDSEK